MAFAQPSYPLTEWGVLEGRSTARVRREVAAWHASVERFEPWHEGETGMKTLGACASGDCVHFAVIANGELVDAVPKRFVVPGAVVGGERLLAIYRGLKASVRATAPDALALFIPVYPPKFHPSYQQARERAQLETLLELAAAESGINVHLVSSPEARHHLGMKARAAIADAAAEALDLEGRPEYWGAGRGEAAAAALVWSEDDD